MQGPGPDAGAVLAAGVHAPEGRPPPTLTWPHSVHSLSARSSLATVAWVSSSTGLPDSSWISDRAATALATTMGLASPIRSWRGGGRGGAQSQRTQMYISS